MMIFVIDDELFFFALFGFLLFAQVGEGIGHLDSLIDPVNLGLEIVQDSELLFGKLAGLGLGLGQDALGLFDQVVALFVQFFALVHFAAPFICAISCSAQL